jgi:hypothetical protein
MRYRKVRLSGRTIHQELYVGGVLRKVLIGRDNWVGEEITDTDGVGGPDTDKAFARFLMLSWRETDFKSSYADNIKMTPPEPIRTPLTGMTYAGMAGELGKDAPDPVAELSRSGSRRSGSPQRPSRRVEVSHEQRPSAESHYSRSLIHLSVQWLKSSGHRPAL